MYVQVRGLAPALRRALDEVGYRGRDVEVVVADSVSPLEAGGEGRRGYVTVVNLDTGERRTTRGSWGGANMFSPDNAVDLDGGRYPIPPGGAVVKGTTGSRTTATVYTTATGRLLPSGEPDDTTDEEQQALYCHVGIVGGQARRDELARRGVRPETVDRLVGRGLLKRNRAGATQVTTAGKNALDRSRVRY